MSRASHPRPRRAVLAVVGALAMAVTADCGARTGLPSGEPCSTPGRMQSCSNACGDGEQTCTNGFWGTCIVPEARRACANVCGDGEQLCLEGQWQTSCTVPPATRRCTSVCGTGTERCTDGALGPCDAPPPEPPTLHATVRDFLVPQPDFYDTCCQPSTGPGASTGMVAFDLGADGKPVYTGPGTGPDPA